LLNSQEWVNKVYDINESEVLLFVTSMGFDLSCYDIFGILAAGGRPTIRNPMLGKESLQKEFQVAS
jgi:surfactin family lipopeptide synthetase A